MKLFTKSPEHILKSSQWSVYSDNFSRFAQANLQLERYLEENDFEAIIPDNEKLRGNYNLYMIYEKEGVAVELVFSTGARIEAGNFLRRWQFEPSTEMWRFTYSCIESVL